jgi:cytochrome-b5 reductase
MAMESLNYIAIAIAIAIVLYTQLFAGKKSAKVLDVSEFKEFPLIQKTVVSHNTALYRFGLPNATDRLGLPIGQHVSVAAHIGDKEIVRSYTPTSSDDELGYFDLLVKSYPTGNVSKHFANLNLGDKIRVRGPKGQFKYERGLVDSLSMVAGGSGITPMYQVLQAIAKDPSDKTKVVLIYANVTFEDILLKKELDQLAAEHDNISVYYVLNNPPENWTGGVGFVTPDILQAHLFPPSSRTKVLLCGPPPMVSSLKKALPTIGYVKPKPLSKLEDQVFAF